MGRRLKQLVYGLLYLAILGGIVFGFYLIFIRPAPSCFNGVQDQGELGVDCGGPCRAPCVPERGVTPVDGVAVLPIDVGHVSLLAQVQNPNLNLAAWSFTYTLSITDKTGNPLHSLYGHSYMYAGEAKYLFAVKVDMPPATIGRADIQIGSTTWVYVADMGDTPSLAVQALETMTSSSSLTVSGVVANNDITSFPQVTILAIFKNQSGSIVGLSQTQISNLSLNEKRGFIILHPPLGDVNPGFTQVFTYALRP